MSLESALAQAGQRDQERADNEALRADIVKTIHPSDMEDVRAALYDKLQDKDVDQATKAAALQYLRAMPTKAPIETAAAPRERPPARESVDLAPNQNPEGNALQRGLKQAFPKPTPGQGDPLQDLTQGQGVQNVILSTAGGAAARFAGELVPEAAAALEEASPVARRIFDAGRRVFGKVPNPTPVAQAAGAAANATTKLGTGAAIGAGGAASAGGNPKEGALMGLLLAAPGAGLDAMTSPNLSTSDILAATEKAGGKPGFLGPGRLRAPEAQGLPFGEKGTVELGVRGQRRLLGDMEAERAGMKADITAGEESAIARNGDQPVDTTRMVDKATSIAKSRMKDDGTPLDPHLVNEALNITRALQKPGVPGVKVAGGAPGAPGAPASTAGGYPEPDAVAPAVSGAGARYETVPGKPLNEITLREAIALKKSLRDRADLGGPSTPEARAARAVAGELSDIGHGADPTYDAALTDYATRSAKLEHANDVFGGRFTSELPDRAAVERGMQKRVAELGRDPYLTRQALEVAQEKPEWSDLINAVVARNGMQLRLGGGGSPQSTFFRTAMGDARALALRTAPLGRASNANLPLIPLEAAAIENARRKKKPSLMGGQ